jgi:L-ascorbate metabolism protein UlaG (beta-lactamase superfamily)
MPSRLALLALLLAAGACCEFSSPRYHGPKTDHFDGERLHNFIDKPVPASAYVNWVLHRQRGAWTSNLDAPPGPPPPRRVADGDLRVTWVNHATVLIQVDGFNILTDPIWGDVAGPVPFAGSHRRHSPGLRLEDLPPIDLILLSHNHYDHMDLPTLYRLEQAHHPTIVAGLGQRALLKAHGLKHVIELDWGRKLHLAHNKLVIIGVPARHGCMRGACDHDTSLWLGFVILSHAGNVYFAGDTGYGPHLQQIGDRYGPFRLALLPIAPSKPRELFGAVHLDAAEAVRAAQVTGAQQSMAIHFGTFAQGDDSETEPIELLEKTLRATPGVNFRVPRFGEGWDVPKLVTRPPAGEGS